MYLDQFSYECNKNGELLLEQNNNYKILAVKFERLHDDFAQDIVSKCVNECITHMHNFIVLANKFRFL